jgi:ubiquitin carboxyl-terminal hydrolase 10
LSVLSKPVDHTTVLYHHGPHASGGHYTLDVLHPNRDNHALPPLRPREAWIRIDDELVSDIKPEDVFAPPKDEEGGGGRCAYLLFYRRVVGVGVGKGR